MWYEIIPSFAIITGLMAAPAYGIYFMNKAVLGNAYRRNLCEHWDQMMYGRDRRLTGGNPYQSPGLEAIPDK